MANLFHKVILCVQRHATMFVQIYLILSLVSNIWIFRNGRSGAMYIWYGIWTWLIFTFLAQNGQLLRMPGVLTSCTSNRSRSLVHSISQEMWAYARWSRIYLIPSGNSWQLWRFQHALSCRMHFCVGTVASLLIHWTLCMFYRLLLLTWVNIGIFLLLIKYNWWLIPANLTYN